MTPARASRGEVIRMLPRFLRYGLAHWRLLAVSVGTSFAAAFAGALAPWPMKVIVDNVLGDHPLPPALADVAAVLPGTDTPHGLAAWAAATTVFLFVFKAAIGTAAAFANVLLNQRVTFDVAGDMFESLQRLSMRFHATRATGDAIRRVTVDASSVSTIIIGAILPIGVAVFTMFSMFSLMWKLDQALIPYSLAAVPLMLYSLWRYSPAMVERSVVEQNLEGELWSMVEQDVSAAPVVQSFTAEERTAAQFDRGTQQLLAANLATTWAQLRFKISIGASAAFAATLVLAVGAHHVVSGALTLGGILVFLAYLQGFYGPLDAIISSQSTLGSVAGSVGRIKDILEARPDVEDRPNARWVKRARVQGHLAFHDVHFGYNADHPVLKGVSFDARPGETIAIVGPSGAGKSTLVSMVPRFYDPDHGHISLDGTDLRDIQLRSLRSHISVVLQEPFLFPITVAENIAYGDPRTSRSKIEDAARAANAHEFICGLPDGYETMVGQRGAKLSGGQRQRIAIARALLKNAPILVLDEPTSALDPVSEGLLLEALGRLMHGRTTIVIAHRLSTIRDADRIVVLEAGRVVESGTHSELMRRRSTYARLHAAQSGRRRRTRPEPVS